MRFKSVIGAFLFILLASSIALVVFVQTRSFGSLVTKVVSDITQRKTKSEVKIKSLNFSVFPPGIELNKVSFKKTISDVEKIEAEFGKIGLYISLIEVEERRLTLGEIRISDSDLHFEFPKSEDELKEIDEAIINKVFDTVKKSPIGINTLILENSRIFANHDLLEARRLKIFKKDDSFITRFHLANIQPSPDIDFSLDEVWGDAEISRKDLKIYRLKVQHDVQTVVAKGRVKNYRLLKNAEASINGDGYIHLMSLNNIIEFPEMIKIEDGFAKIGFGLNYQNQLITGKSNVILENFRSNMFYADELQAGVELKDSKVILNSLQLKYENEKASVLQPTVMADLDNGTYLQKPILASVENVSLTNALRILPELNVLKGELNGELSFEYKKGGDLFFRPKDNFIAKNIALVVGSEKPFTILKIKQAKVKGSEFSVIKNNFHMNAAIELAHSKLEVDGFVSKEEVKFHVPESQIDLEDFGNIANLDIKGAGPISVNVSGPLDDTIINLRGKTKGFEILGYRLGDADKNISIELKDSNVVIHKMESQQGKTHLSGTGLVNYDTAEIALGINTNETNFYDLNQALHPILKNIDFLPEDLELKARVDVDIFGKYRLPELKIKAGVDFVDLTAYGEHVNRGSFQVSLLNEVLSFKNLSADKGKGSIQGNFFYGLNDRQMKLNYSWENLDLNSFQTFKRLGLNFNGNVAGTFAGSGTSKNYHFKLASKIFDTKSQSYQYKDSDIALDLYTDRIGGSVNLFGKIIESDFDYYWNSNQRSRIKLNVDAQDLKPFSVAIFGQQLESESFTGQLAFNLDSSFQRGFENLDLIASLKNLTFNHADFSVNHVSKRPEFVVKNSAIQAWNLNIKGSDLYLVTKGEGVFGKHVSLVHEIHLNSKILEILLAPVLSSEGFLRNIVRIEGKGTKYDFSISSKTDELNMSIDSLPIAINNLKYSLEYSDKRLVIQELSTALDNGLVMLKGDIFFDENEPDVNLKYQLERAEIPILGKSSINLTGEGIILGNKMPYNVGGEIVVNRALIVNELNEFGSKSAALSQVRFLPKNQESAFGKLISLNVDVKAENPVRVTNSLMDVFLKGEVRIYGSPTRPRGEGRLFAPANSSRIFFKNNEYLITSADINFNPKKDISNPDFDVQAMTVISNYKVYPKAYGDLERFNFDLTSDPALARNSILSLIAFGYSDEIQSTLRQDQQQSLNQVGVGSFVFDQFKISDILKKQFGLQVNLGTVFEQSSTDSLLAGRSQEGSANQATGALGRTRSATKIELKKRLDEATTLSVSSTMGGGIGQRQTMNLNYGLSQKVQLEGVYEQRTNDEGQEDQIYNSVGADVKFRWTFK